jgi:HSP20 family protein
MDIKKIVPTNWFSREESQTGNLPAQQEVSSFGSLARLHQEMDRLFENAFRDFRLPSDFSLPSVKLGHLFDNVTLRPKVDVASTDKEYTVTFEIPGVDEEDVKLELAHDGTLTVKGEKRQEKEQKDKNFYRVERSYGSFQRTLSLPEDADHESMNASFKNGVLTITCARKAVAQAPTRRIEIRKAG